MIGNRQHAPEMGKNNSCCTEFYFRRALLETLQCVAVCCSVLQCVAVCCSVLQCVAISPVEPSSIFVEFF